MQKSYTRYNKLTGQILGTFSCPEMYAIHQYDNTINAAIEGTFDFTYQINLNTLQAEKIPLIHADYPAYHITELQQYIQDDNALDKAIENLHEDPITYKQDNYELFRKWAYPDSMEYIDAAIKQKDSKRKKDGDKQMADYVNKCIVVKDRFPKKEE